MKSLLYILPFLILPLLATQADTIAHEQGMPLFIVDGKVGVSKNDIPSPDEIASTTFMSYKEGVELFGKRATNGVLIIRTKNYEKEHVQEVQNAGKQQNRGKKNQPGKLGRFIQKITGGNHVLSYILTGIIVLSLYALPIVIPKIITKCKKRHKKSRGRKPTYYSGTFDASGEVFRVTDNPWYFVILLLLMGSAVGVCIILYQLATSPKASFSVVSVLVFLFFVALLVFLCCLAYGYFEKRKCHLIIDKDGIRGTFAKPERLRSNRSSGMLLFVGMTLRMWRCFARMRAFWTSITKKGRLYLISRFILSFSRPRRLSTASIFSLSAKWEPANNRHGSNPFHLRTAPRLS